MRGGDMPLLNAYLTMAFFLGINVWTIEGVTSALCTACDVFWPAVNQLDFQARRALLMMVAIVLFGLLYFRWIHAGQYKQFFKEYGAETESSRRAGSVLVAGYISGSVVLYGLSFLLV